VSRFAAAFEITTLFFSFGAAVAAVAVFAAFAVFSPAASTFGGNRSH